MNDRSTTTTFLVTVAGVLGGTLGALLVPWAVVHGRAGGAGLVAVALLLAVSGLGFVYAWRRGEPDWRERDGSTPR